MTREDMRRIVLPDVARLAGWENAPGLGPTLERLTIVEFDGAPTAAELEGQCRQVVKGGTQDG